MAKENKNWILDRWYKKTVYVIGWIFVIWFVVGFFVEWYLNFMSVV